MAITKIYGVTDLKAKTLSDTSIAISFTPSKTPGSLNYMLTWAGGSAPLPTASYTVTGLASSTSYTFTVTVSGIAGAANGSTYVKGKTSATPTPHVNAVTNLKAVSHIPLGISITFTPSTTPGALYTAKLSSSEGSINLPIPAALAAVMPTIPFVVPALQSGTSYKVQVLTSVSGSAKTSLSRYVRTKAGYPVPTHNVLGASTLNSSLQSESEHTLSGTVSGAQNQSVTIIGKDGSLS